jgi:hypothetical protein
MEKHTDESVKAGLQIEADTNPLKEQQKKSNADTGYKDAAKETDADELVHEKENNINTGNKEQDPDELLHSSHSFKTVRDSNEADPDDLVHENNEDPFDE